MEKADQKQSNFLKKKIALWFWLAVFFIFVPLIFALFKQIINTISFDQTSIIKNAKTYQSERAVAGKAIKWAIIVDLKQIKSGEYLIKIPKSAKNIKARAVNLEEAQKLSVLKNPQLTLEEKKVLALDGNNKNSFVASLNSSLKLFFAEAESAVSSVAEAVVSVISSVSDAPAQTVDVSGIIAEQASDTSQSSQASSQEAVEEQSSPEVAETQQSVDNSDSGADQAQGETFGDQPVLGAEGERQNDPKESGAKENETLDVKPRDEMVNEKKEFIVVEYTTEKIEIREVKTKKGKIVVVSIPDEVDFSEPVIPEISPEQIFDTAPTLLPEAAPQETTLPELNPTDIPINPGGSSLKIESLPVLLEDSVSDELPDSESKSLSPGPLENSEQTLIPENTPSPLPIVEEPSVTPYEIPKQVHLKNNLLPVNILAHTTLPEIFKTGQEKNIKIIWKNNGNKEVDFSADDLDENGFIDYVEWNIPHLSEQIFEIIFISKAFELDENKDIVKDVYDLLKEKDDQWAGVAKGHYIRATFEKMLDSAKDNTIYARTKDPKVSAKIEVYPVYEDENGDIAEGPLVATFENISEEGQYKIFLNQLETPTDTFDLKIIGEVEIDWIVDPGVTLYWVGSAGGNTSTAANWSTTEGACTGAGNGTAPTSADTIIFTDSCDNNATVSATTTVSAMTVNTGYAGIITLNSYNLTVSNNLTFNAGTINYAAARTLTVNGTLIFGGGAITATSIAIIISANTITYSAGSITANTSGNIIINSNGTPGAFSLPAITGAATINVGNLTAPSSITINATIQTTSAGNAIWMYSNGNITQSANISSAGTAWFFSDSDSNDTTTTYTQTGGYNITGNALIAVGSTSTTNFHYAGGIATGTIKMNNSYVPGNLFIDGDISGTGVNFYSKGDITQNANITSTSESVGIFLDYDSTEADGIVTYTTVSGTVTGTVNIYAGASTTATLVIAGMTVVGGTNSINFPSNYPANISVTGNMSATGRIWFASKSGFAQSANISSTSTALVYFSLDGDDNDTITNFTYTSGTITGASAFYIGGSGTSNTDFYISGINVTSNLKNSSSNYPGQLYITGILTTGGVTELYAKTNIYQNASITGSGAVTLYPKKGGVSGQSYVAGNSTISCTTLTSSGGSLTINSGYTLDANGCNITVSGTGTTFTNNGTLKIKGSETITTPTNAAGSLVQYYATGTTTIQNWTYNSIRFSSAGAVSYNIPAALTLAGSLTIDASNTLIATSNRAINVAGNWSNSGTFTAGSGTVTLNGTSQTLSGATTFNNLTAVTPDQVIIFPQASTTTVSGTLKLEGSSGHNILLKSDEAGTDGQKAHRARLDIAAVSDNHGHSYFQYVTPYDNDASHGAAQPIQTQNCADGGNNLGWALNTAPTLISVSDNPDPIKGGSTITIAPTGQGDAESNTLYYYCNESGTPTSASTLCSQANTGYSSPYLTMTCTYNVSSGDTTRTVYCRAYDGADYSTERTTTYTVDTTAPLVGVTTLSGFTTYSAYIKGTGTILGGTATDIGGSGIDISSCEYTIDNGSNWLSGSWDAGNTRCYKDNVLISNGVSYTFSTRVKDLATNQGTGTATISYAGDTAVPTTTDNSDTDWHAANQTIILTPLDTGGSGAAHTYYCVDTNKICSPTTEGTSVNVICSADQICQQYVSYYSSDNLANNEATKYSNLIGIDKTIPDTTAAATAGGNPYVFGDWTNQVSVIVTLSCTDTGSGCNTTKYCTDATNTCVPSTNYDPANKPTVTDKGTSYIRFFSTDNVSNSETADSKTIKINAASTITGGPSDQSSSATAPTNAGSNVAFTATAADGQSDNYYLAVCKTDVITANNSAAPVCPGGDWCISGSTASGSEASCNYTTLDSDSESNSWYVFVCDHNSASLCSSSSQGAGDSGSPFIVNHKPSYTNISASPSTSYIDHVITFTATSSDSDTSGENDTVQLYVCKSNSFDGNSCSGGEWCHTGLSASNPSCSFTGTLYYLGTNNYYGFVKDSHNLSIINPIFSSFEIVSYPPKSGSASFPSYSQPTPLSVPEIEKPIVEINNGVTEKIGEFLGPKPLPTEKLEFPLIDIPTEAPLSMSGKIYLIPEKELETFVFAPLSNKLLDLSLKFPKFNTILNKLGIKTMSDVVSLKNYSISLPSLRQSIDLPENSHLSVDLLTNEQKEKIPVSLVYAKLGLDNIDVISKLDISNQGVVDQKINVLANKKISFIVKPQHETKSIKGYLVFKSKPKVNLDKNNNMFASAAKALLAAISSVPPFASSNNGNAEIEEKLVVMEFEYTDPDNDGIYTAEINAPIVEGNYDVMTVIEYEDSDLGSKVMHLVTVVDPEGYVYTKVGSGEMRISAAKVSLYWLNKENKNYELWPAKDFGQENPQITDNTGKYSFLVPEGKYYIRVETQNYFPYQSEVLDVTEGEGIHKNIELKFNNWIALLLDWKTLVILSLSAAVVFLLFCSKKKPDKCRPKENKKVKIKINKF